MRPDSAVSWGIKEDSRFNKISRLALTVATDERWPVFLAIVDELHDAVKLDLVCKRAEESSRVQWISHCMSQCLEAGFESINEFRGNILLHQQPGTRNTLLPGVCQEAL